MRKGSLSPKAITGIGAIINVVLSAGKIVTGVLCGSQAILADGFHSASDLVTDLAVLWGLRISGRPADEDHHFGHLRAATLVALFVGAMLFVAAGWIVVGAIIGLRERRVTVEPEVPFLWAVASVALKEGLFRATLAVGKREMDPSLLANAWHHRTDAFTSVAAAIGLGAIMLLGEDWGFLDNLTAAILAIYLCYIAIGIVRNASAELMDRAPDPSTMTTIKKAVAETPGVKGFHAVRARQVGGRVSMDIHVLVDPNISVYEGHKIAEEVEQRIRGSTASVVHVVVHIEPAD